MLSVCINNVLYHAIIFFFFLAALGLCCCAQLSLVAASRALLFIVVCGLLIAVASLVGSLGSRRAGFSSCGAWAQ